ncbi:MAG: hypothetical protein QF735_09345, partial [Phycisphaeraceae bacterium]|nr:hypothetical protein [Phycisphaeraceae bacterium]
MTRSHIGVVVVVAMTLASVGCVGQQGYDDLLVRYRTCEEQLIELSAQVEERDFCPDDSNEALMNRFFDFFCIRGYAAHRDLLEDGAKAEQLT